MVIDEELGGFRDWGMNLRRTGGGNRSGFSLIELAIVLVIVGLVIGGVLLGKDLIQAAKVRAQIAQLQSFQAATRAFETKYLALPGDIQDRLAQRFGFAPRGPFRGQGDGNGIIEGNCGCGTCNLGVCQSSGEPSMFWVDSSAAGLVQGSFRTASATAWPGPVSGAALSAWLPQGKIGRGSYVYVFGYTGAGSVMLPSLGIPSNYFGLSAVTSLALTNSSALESAPALTVAEAYSIDMKIDDGLPLSGNVQTIYLSYTLRNFWPTTASGGGIEGSLYGAPAPASSVTCYDNGNVGGGAYRYSVSYGGTGINCALSFRFQ